MRELALPVTKANYFAVVEDRKTQTRRLSCRYKVGDLCYLPEPTQVLSLSETYPEAAKVLYLWTGETLDLQITKQDLERLLNRTDWRKPAIARFMLKSLARQWVRITEIRKECLVDISKEDAVAEGIERVIATRERFGCRAAGLLLYRDYADKREPWQRGYEDNAIASFSSLWDSIHGKDLKACWAANPIVYPISFERVTEQARVAA